MREKIETRYAMMTNDFGRKENLQVVRKSDYAKLEARLEEAVALIDWVNQEAHYNSGFMHTIVRIRHKTRKFLTTIDQEKEKSDV